MLQDLLRLDKPMSIDCFNFGVRMFSNEKATLLMDPLCYFANLQLCVCLFSSASAYCQISSLDVCLFSNSMFFQLQSNYKVWYRNRSKRDQCLLMNVFPANLETGVQVLTCDLVSIQLVNTMRQCFPTLN